MNYFVEIHVPGHCPQRHELVGDWITVGTAASASIRTPVTSGSETGPIELSPCESGVRVQVPTGADGALAFEGKQHRRVLVPWGGEVFVGNVRLTFLEYSASKHTGPVLLLMAPVVLILLGLGIFRAALPNAVSDHEVPAPLLFDEQQSGKCPRSEPSAAEHRAREDERAALAKQERSAFDATDGADAAFLFRDALACFRTSGKAEDASRVAGELARWNGRLNERYAALRLRLRVALDKEHHADALAAVRELQALLAHREEGPYRQWLLQLGRSLERRVIRSSS